MKSQMEICGFISYTVTSQQDEYTSCGADHIWAIFSLFTPETDKKQDNSPTSSLVREEVM